VSTELPRQVLHFFSDADRLLQANGETRCGVSPFFFHGVIDMLVAELIAPVSDEALESLSARGGADPDPAQGGQRCVLP